MKLKIFTLMALAGSLTTFSQSNANPQRCSVMEHEEYLQQKNPNRKAEREAFQQALNKWVEKNQKNTSTNKSQTLLTIPVVVHMVYQNAAQNLTDAQILTQIAVLNQDFTHTNPDASNTPSIFQGLAGNAGMNWCMAQVDPNGNPTTGIVHKSTTHGAFGTDDAVKFTAQGGDDAWPTNKYFNIWVCDLGSQLLGYGEFPTGTLSNTFGFVANITCYGVGGSAVAPYNKGRTGTHEIGHCFNLFHIWGDEPACAADDGVNDTPKQKGENYGTPSFPQGTSAGGGCCTAADQSSMYMNYMDYTDDAAMNMFTTMQCTKMIAVLSTAPYNALTTSTVCGTAAPTGANDAGALNITSPNGAICANTISPVATIKNHGSAALTSVKVNYNLNGGANSFVNWTGNLATGATATVNLTSMPVANGTHTLNVFTSNPNGATDAATTNDATSKVFNVTAGGSSSPLIQDFETATAWPYPGYTITNGDGATTWALASVGHSGTKSIFMDNYNYNANGELDEVLLPSVNLNGITGSASLKFWLAYQTYTSPSTAGNSWDTLSVLVSTNCGATWTSLYKKFGSTLITANPQFSTNEFTPVASDWRQETVNLNSYLGQGSVMVKLSHITNYENQLYIDDINIDFVTGLAHNNVSNEFKIFPNPTTGKVILNFTQPTTDKSSISIVNVLGEKVMTQNLTTSVLNAEVDLSHLNNGVYFIEISSNNISTIQRIILSK